MFNNIGGKIKTLAKVICWFGIIASVILGIIMITARSGYRSDPYFQVVYGILIIVVGCLISWIGSFFTYGFGQLIENSDYIRNNMQSRD